VASTVLVKDIYSGLPLRTPQSDQREWNAVSAYAGRQRPGTLEERRHGIGTVLVKDISPGSASSNPAGLTKRQWDAVLQRGRWDERVELWKDGTGHGTVLFKDINPGSALESNFLSTSTNAVLRRRQRARLPATVDERRHQCGTNLVVVINSTTQSSAASGFVMSNGITFLPPMTGPRPGALEHRWYSSGHGMVADVNPGSAASSPSYLTMSTYAVLRRPGQ